MITPADIAEYGERHVLDWLTSTGYHCHATKPHHGASDIEARGEEDNLFVHVMAALEGHEVPELSTTDRGRVLSKAMTLGYDAWLAQLHVDTEGALIGDIQWSQLNQ